MFKPCRVCDYPMHRAEGYDDDPCADWWYCPYCQATYDLNEFVQAK